MALQTNNSKVSVYDPYNSKECYRNNSENRIEKLKPKNQEWIRQRCEDLEKGKNLTGKKKGKPRSYRYINCHQQKIIRIALIAEQMYNKALVELSEDEITNIFDAMRENKIKKLRQKNGTMEYEAVDNFAVHFKAFWHWYMTYNRKVNGKQILDITEDLDSSNEREPEFVYFTLESLKKLAEEAKYPYRVFMYFLFDSGMRVTEALNIKKKDFQKDPKSNNLLVEVRNETSKTFGRKIKLMICSDIVREYIRKQKFKPDDYVFKIARPNHINEYLKRTAKRVFGENLEGLEENKSSKLLTMYDFRHSSACYWLPRYQSESVLKWRFGWKNSEMIHYYTKFLGMRDTITEDDMLIDTTKTELEKQLDAMKQERDIMAERMALQEKQMAQIHEYMKQQAKKEIKQRAGIV